MTISATIDVRRAGDRFATRLPWLDSHHSFSFSRHYDPANTHHGVLLVNNDDIVRAGTGFSTHPHQDARFAHLFVAPGALTLEGAGRLEAGDAVRFTEAGAPSITADASEGAEVLMWELAG